MGARSLWKPSNQGLEKLGFPWILSSEISLFNRLREIIGAEIFSAPSRPQWPGNGRGGGRGGDRPWIKLSDVSDYLQANVASRRQGWTPNKDGEPPSTIATPFTPAISQTCSSTRSSL